MVSPEFRLALVEVVMKSDLEIALEETLKEFKAKPFAELLSLEGNVAYRSITSGKDDYEAEIEVRRVRADLIAACAMVSRREQRFFVRSLAKYFGVKPNGTIVLNKDLVVF